ncbi:MAG TPA: hypothetical protein P5534_17470 [Candidatus Paceibacterota bacterium]|nr:hypothetical protein [Candidatus Paceibacterota bacterium]
MITLINASAFRSDEGGSTPLTPEGCREYLTRYASSKVRLWAYHCSLSRLVLRIDRPAHESLRPIDLVFVSVSDIRCPVHWLLGAIEIRDNPESPVLFGVPSADVSISASDLTIVVQDEYPHKLWELESGRIA